MRSRRAAGAWALVASVLAAWCLAAVAAWAGMVPSLEAARGASVLGGPADAATGTNGTGSVADQGGLADQAAATGRQVVLVGVPGLTWDLVDEDRTPTLTRLSREGGAAALVVRGTHEVTCAGDAWLTVGAGQRAATDLPGCGDASDEGASAAGAWQSWQQAAAGRALGPRLGTLADLAEEAGTCVAAYGDLAGIGAARPDGSIAVGVPSEPGTVGTPAVGQAGLSDRTCRIHLVSAPEVQDGDRSGQLPAIDSAVDEIATGLPTGTTLLVAGLGHTADRAEAQVLITHPVHVRDGAGASLSSGSTRQQGLVQLTDLTPTLLALAGVDHQSAEHGSALAGQVVTAAPQVGDHVAQAGELAAGVSAAKMAAPVVLGMLFAVVLLGLAIGLLLLWRDQGRLRPALVVTGAASLAMAVPAATFLAGLVPWWAVPFPTGSVRDPRLTLLLLVLGIAAVIAALAWAGPWRRHPLGPPAIVAAVTAVVLGVDVIWSARLGLVSVLGLQPVTAGRFYGQGNVGFGILLGCVLVLMAAVLTWLRARRWEATAAVLLLGLGATVLNGAPQAGADFGGVPSLVVLTGLVALAAAGVRWTWLSLLAVAAAGGLAAALVMVLDWARGPEQRTHLGEFVQSALDGEAVGIVTRKLAQSLGILVGYPIAWLVVLALAGVAVVAWRRPRWAAPLERHAGWSPALRAGVLAMVLGWVLNDSGLPAAGAALAMTITAALTVLGRAPQWGTAARPDGPVAARGPATGGGQVTRSGPATGDDPVTAGG